MIRLFAHRGFAENKLQQNTITSLNQAKEKGFVAVEFDIWFFEGKLVLKHDEPKENEIKNLPNFSDYLVFQNEFFYWLDFKNLSRENARKVLLLVRNKIEECKIDLKRFYFAPFITDYILAAEIFEIIRNVFGEDVQLIAVCERLDSEKEINELRQFLTKRKIKFLSTFHELINQNLVQKFSDINFFAWTVNDLKRLKELQNLGVKNFATDKILPKDLN